MFSRTKVPRTISSKLCARPWPFKMLMPSIKGPSSCLLWGWPMRCVNCRSAPGPVPCTPSPHPRSWRYVANTQKIPIWWSGMQLTRQAEADIQSPSCSGQISERPCQIMCSTSGQDAQALRQVTVCSRVPTGGRSRPPKSTQTWCAINVTLNGTDAWLPALTSGRQLSLNFTHKNAKEGDQLLSMTGQPQYITILPVRSLTEWTQTIIRARAPGAHISIETFSLCDHWH